MMNPFRKITWHHITDCMSFSNASEVSDWVLGRSYGLRRTTARENGHCFSQNYTKFSGLRCFIF